MDLSLLEGGRFYDERAGARVVLVCITFRYKGNKRGGAYARRVTHASIEAARFDRYFFQWRGSLAFSELPQSLPILTSSDSVK